ncbi:MAG: hypothetical protein RLZZ135_2715, partial [Cyanobacteriota bacterium]
MPFTSPTSATPLPQILGYLLVEEIYVGDLTAVYRAIAQSDNRSAIVTILRSDSPPCDDLLQFRHQYTIVKNLNLSGVALLELLTGELPFQADAPGELIQAQIVRSPALVSVLNPDVPDMVAAIVAKLVAKNPEDRYQTALGLQHDLNICIDRWSATGKIDRFELGLPDLSDQLSIDCLNQSKSDLIAAERCRVLGDRLNAIELYDRSISGAIADADLQQAATSNELAARFYLGWGKEKIATVYLQEAYAYFARCGAISKTEDLKNCYPHFLAPISPPQQPFDRLSHPTAIVDPAQSYLSASASAELQPQVRGSSYVDLAAVWEFDQVLANNIPGVIYKFRVDTNEQIS